MPRFFGLTLLLSLILAACSNDNSAQERSYLSKIKKLRVQKDSSFAVSEHSPILRSERAGFTGLNYYKIDPALKFSGPIIKYESVILDTILGSRGDVRPAQKYGYFEFRMEDKKYQLQIYKILKNDPVYQKYLFLGFTDQTSGSETYGAGRYIDLTEQDANYYTVDFNLAFNPYCAYNPKYTCAMPPQENYLPFRMEAGEKIFKKH